MTSQPLRTTARAAGTTSGLTPPHGRPSRSSPSRVKVVFCGSRHFPSILAKVPFSRFSLLFLSHFLTLAQLLTPLPYRLAWERGGPKVGVRLARRVPDAYAKSRPASTSGRARGAETRFTFQGFRAHFGPLLAFGPQTALRPQTWQGAWGP